MKSKIKLNNGDEVVETLKSEELTSMATTHNVLVEHSTFGGAEITEENINKNSEFVINCWHNNHSENEQ